MIVGWFVSKIGKSMGFGIFGGWEWQGVDTVMEVWWVDEYDMMVRWWFNGDKQIIVECLNECWLNDDWMIAMANGNSNSSCMDKSNGGGQW